MAMIQLQRMRWQVCHRLRAFSLPCFPSRPCQLIIGIQRSGTASSSNDGQFESNRLSATVRQQRGSESPSSSKVIPGRLIRRQRRAIPSTPPPVSVHDNESATELQPRQARRNAAMEQRRAFLKSGGTTSLPSSVASISESVIEEADLEIASCSNDERGMASIDSSSNESNHRAHEANEDDSTNAIQFETQQPMTCKRQPGRRRISLHSIGNDELSAADVYRSQIKQQREEHQRQLQKQRLQRQEQENADGTRASGDGNIARAPMELNVHHAISVGESLVASQSATARYRQRRKDGGRGKTSAGHCVKSKLDTNLSDMARGLKSDNCGDVNQSSPRSEGEGAVVEGDLTASATGKAKEGWLPFRWLSGKK